MSEVQLQQPKSFREARNRFFPGWWIYSRANTQDSLKPLYRVVCRTRAEQSLARAVKPTCVRARILYLREGQVERLSVMRHALVERLGASEEEIQSWINDGRVSVPFSRLPESLTATEADQFLIQKVSNDASAIFANPTAWLNAPNPRLGGASPREMIAAGQVDLVLEVLDSLKHGMIT
ncbi:DUF2384 domain-containing protein [Candidatus Peribacteria bacterium]|nr:DUF2384 domain-containing protein [Candidatus Peribacteria bacterium]